MSIYGILAIIAYLFPAINGFWRKHRNAVPIAIINVAFGWTVIGWVVACAWSYGADVKK